jgi:uncharacterized protein YdaU (DUF1376 family)
MHGYFHHIGDWMTHTAYCDWMVKAAYLELLMAYYTAEAPFPNDFRALYRAIGATTRAEKEATERALHQFFKLGPDGMWHQKRADAEIAKARELAQTQKANAINGWQKRGKGKRELPIQDRVSVDVASLLKMGIVEPHGSGIETNPRGTLADVNGHSADADGNATAMPGHMPTISHNPLNTLNAAAAAVAACERAREAAAAGGIEIKADDPRLAALVADGATPGEFRMAAARATAGGKGVAWLFAAVSGMRQDSASGMTREGAKTGSGSPNYPMLPRWYER